MNTNNIVEILWVDSYSRVGWEDLDAVISAARNIDLRCATVGYLAEETPDRVIILASLAHSNLVQNAMVIPKECILDIRVVYSQDEEGENPFDTPEHVVTTEELDEN